MWSGYSEQGRGGQERGPGAFSAQPSGVPQAYVAGQDAEGVRAGVRGGSGTPTGNVVIPERQDKTMQTLLRLGQDALSKQFAKMEEQAFLDGWAKAASGTALDELQAEQPAWARVFGDSATVEGARAYQAQAVVDNWVVATEQRMDELRKLPPSAVPGKLYGEVDALLTGDPATDAMIRGHLFKAAVPLIKRHTKEHVGWQQAEARTARGKTFRSSAAKLEAMAAAEAQQPGTYTESDLNLARMDLMTSISPADGMNLPTWERDVVDFMAEAAAGGQFQVVRVLRETGALDKLAPDDRAKLDATIRRAAGPALVKVAPKFVSRLLDLQERPDASDEEIMAGLTEINAEAAALAGVPEDYGQLVPFGQYDTYVAAARNAKTAAERDAARKAAASVKEHEDAVKDSLLVNADGSGVLDQFASMQQGEGTYRLGQLGAAGVTPKQVQEAGFVKFQQLSPEQRGAFLSAFPGFKFDAVEAALGSWWTQATGDKAEYSAAYAQLAQLWAGSSEAVRGDYFTAEQNAELRDFTAAVASNVPPESAFLMRKGTVQQAKGRTRPPQKDALVKAITKYAADPQQSWLSPDLPDFDTALVANIVGAEAVARPEYGVDDDVAAERAYGRAVSAGRFSIVGNRAVVNVDPDGARKTPLEVLTAQPPGITATAFEQLITERITASGGDADERLVIRLPDMQGKARYMVESTDAKGRTVFAQLDSEEVKARALANRKGAAEETRRTTAQKRGNEAAARQREAAGAAVFEINR